MGIVVCRVHRVGPDMLKDVRLEHKDPFPAHTPVWASWHTVQPLSSMGIVHPAPSHLSTMPGVSSRSFSESLVPLHKDA